MLFYISIIIVYYGFQTRRCIRVPIQSIIRTSMESWFIYLIRLIYTTIEGAFDFKQRCIEWSVYDIKVPLRAIREQMTPMLWMFHSLKLEALDCFHASKRLTVARANSILVLAVSVHYWSNLLNKHAPFIEWVSRPVIRTFRDFTEWASEIK